MLLLLAGCGFQLRGQAPLPAVVASPYRRVRGPLLAALRRARPAPARRGRDARGGRRDGDRVIRLHVDETGRELLSVTADNKPGEYEVYYAAEFSVTSGATELLPRNAGEAHARLRLRRVGGARQGARRSSRCASRSRQRSRTSSCGAWRPCEPVGLRRLQGRRGPVLVAHDGADARGALLRARPRGQGPARADRRGLRAALRLARADRTRPLHGPRDPARPRGERSVRVRPRGDGADARAHPRQRPHPARRPARDRLRRADEPPVPPRPDAAGPLERHALHRARCGGRRRCWRRRCTRSAAAPCSARANRSRRGRRHGGCEVPLPFASGEELLAQCGARRASRSTG